MLDNGLLSIIELKIKAYLIKILSIQYNKKNKLIKFNKKNT